jgi:MtN3 and saliva related transmembrane protein
MPTETLRIVLQPINRMELKLFIGIAAGVLTAVASLPQIIKIIKEKEAQSVSPVMFFVLLAGNLLWCYYGILLKEWPIIITNGFSSGLDLVMIFLNYKYSKQ